VEDVDVDARIILKCRYKEITDRKKCIEFGWFYTDMNGWLVLT
jgi:hypothetical protein